MEKIEGIEGWLATGHVADVAPQVDRIPAYDRRSGEHFFMILSGYRVDPTQWQPGHQVHLDPENLVSISGPMCYYCEEPYTERLAKRRCPGDP